MKFHKPIAPLLGVVLVVIIPALAKQPKHTPVIVEDITHFPCAQHCIHQAAEDHNYHIEEADRRKFCRDGFWDFFGVHSEEHARRLWGLNVRPCMETNCPRDIWKEIEWETIDYMNWMCGEKKYQYSPAPLDWDVGFWHKKHHIVYGEPEDWNGIPVRNEAEYREHRHKYDKNGRRPRWP